LGLGNYRKTAHEVEIVEMLEICSVLDEHAAVTIMGIIPEDIEKVEIGLTTKIESRFEEYIAHVIKEIESIGCSASKINNKSIKQIAQELIGSYNGEHLSRIPNEEDLTCR